MIAVSKGGLTSHLFDTGSKEFKLQYNTEETTTAEAKPSSKDSIMPLASENVGYELQLMITKLKKAH